MIKVVVLSDSHGNFNQVKSLIDLEKPNKVIFTGDGISQIEEVSYLFPEIEFFLVRGNCDIFVRRYKEVEIFQLEDIKVLITHGHLFDVKREMELLEREAENQKVDLVCFGHTHIPYEIEKNGITYLNPGAFKDGRYALLKIDKTDIKIENKRINL